MSPAYLPNLAGACLNSGSIDEYGIVHFANFGSVPRAEFAKLAGVAVGVDRRTLRSRKLEEMHSPARRTCFGALRRERASLMPLDGALRRYDYAWRGFTARSIVQQRSGISGR